jgi:hypothetical protein
MIDQPCPVKFLGAQIRPTDDAIDKLYHRFKLLLQEAASFSISPP